MDKAQQQSTVYVVYPAAFLDGWEVVMEDDDDPVSFDHREKAIRYAEAQARLDGGAVVKLENWYGEVERIWKVGALEPSRPSGALAAG